MRVVTYELESQVKSIFNVLRVAAQEASDIEKAYFSTDASTTVAAVTNATDPVTVASKLTKQQYLDGITYTQNLAKFFNNQAVTTSDYLTTIQNLRYGNATLATQLSVSVEALGDRMKTLAESTLTQYNAAVETINLYNDNELSDVAAVIDDSRIVYGSNMTKVDMVSAMSLLTQYFNLMTNVAVTTGDYWATLSQWNRYADA